MMSLKRNPNVSRLGAAMIMEGSWFQGIIVRGKKDNLSCDVDIGIYFHAGDPRVVRCANVTQGVQGSPTGEDGRRIASLQKQLSAISLEFFLIQLCNVWFLLYVIRRLCL